MLFICFINCLEVFTCCLYASSFCFLLPLTLLLPYLLLPLSASASSRLLSASSHRFLFHPYPHTWFVTLIRASLSDFFLAMFDLSNLSAKLFNSYVYFFIRLFNLVFLFPIFFALIINFLHLNFNILIINIRLYVSSYFSQFI